MINDLGNRISFPVLNLAVERCGAFLNIYVFVALLFELTSVAVLPFCLSGSMVAVLINTKIWIPLASTITV